MANLKSIKKGDKVILRMFTGAYVDTKTVEMADAKKIGFNAKNGTKMVFSKETGKQVSPEPKNDKYANYLDEYDAVVEAEEAVKKNKPKTKKADKTKATAAKKSTKSKAEPEEVEDDDDFEEVEDEDNDEADDEDEDDGFEEVE